MTTDDRFAALREYIAGRADNDDVLLNVQLVRELLDAADLAEVWKEKAHKWAADCDVIVDKWTCAYHEVKAERDKLAGELERALLRAVELGIERDKLAEKYRDLLRAQEV